MEWFVLRGMLAGVANTFAAQLACKSLKLKVEVDPLLPLSIRGDVNKLRQVVATLLSNACRFNHPGGTIVVSAQRVGALPLTPPTPCTVLSNCSSLLRPRRSSSEVALGAGGDTRCRASRNDGGTAPLQHEYHALPANSRLHTSEGAVFTMRDDIRICVTDTGIGISPEEVQLLMSPFHQLSAGAAEKGNVTGLGLSVAKSIIDLSGGTMGVRSVPGMGSTFFLELPIAGSMPVSRAEFMSVTDLPLRDTAFAQVGGQSVTPFPAVTHEMGPEERQPLHRRARICSERTLELEHPFQDTAEVNHGLSIRVPGRLPSPHSPALISDPNEEKMPFFFEPPVQLLVPLQPEGKARTPSGDAQTFGIFCVSPDAEAPVVELAVWHHAVVVDDVKVRVCSLFSGLALNPCPRGKVCCCIHLHLCLCPRCHAKMCTGLRHCGALATLQSNRELLARLLRRRGVQQVDFWPGGKECLAALERFTLDEIMHVQAWLLDKEMPEVVSSTPTGSKLPLHACTMMYYNRVCTRAGSSAGILSYSCQLGLCVLFAGWARCSSDAAAAWSNCANHWCNWQRAS